MRPKKYKVNRLASHQTRAIYAARKTSSLLRLSPWRKAWGPGSILINTRTDEKVHVLATNEDLITVARAYWSFASSVAVGDVFTVIQLPEVQ